VSVYRTPPGIRRDVSDVGVTAEFKFVDLRSINKHTALCTAVCRDGTRRNIELRETTLPAYEPAEMFFQFPSRQPAVQSAVCLLN
jgi:hypothetical protein